MTKKKDTSNPPAETQPTATGADIAQAATTRVNEELHEQLKEAQAQIAMLQELNRTLKDRMQEIEQGRTPHTDSTLTDEPDQDETELTEELQAATDEDANYSPLRELTQALRSLEQHMTKLPPPQFCMPSQEFMMEIFADPKMVYEQIQRFTEMCLHRAVHHNAPSAKTDKEARALGAHMIRVNVGGLARGHILLAALFLSSANQLVNSHIDPTAEGNATDEKEFVLWSDWWLSTITPAASA